MEYLHKDNIRKLSADDFWKETEIAVTKLRVIMRSLGTDTIQWNKTYDSIPDGIDAHINRCIDTLKENPGKDEAQSYSGFCKIFMWYQENGDIEIEYWFPLN